MKRFFKWTGITAFAALLPLLMAPTGGFPSLPTFQKVTTTYASGFGYTNNYTGTGNYAVQRFQFSGTDKAYIGVDQTAGSLCNASSVGDLCFRMVSGNLRLSSNNGINSFVIPRSSYGAISPGSGTCSITANATIQTQNFASCVCNASGGCTITFTSNYSNPPACTAAGNPFTGTITAVEITSSSTSTVQVQTLAGTTNTSQTAGGLNVMCMGT